MGSNRPVARALVGRNDDPDIGPGIAAPRKDGHARELARVGRVGVSVQAGYRRPALRIDPILVVAGLLGVALAAWIVTIERMEGMDGGPGTDLGGLGWYVG